MPVRWIAVVALAAVLTALSQAVVQGHAGPRLFDPLENATLGDTPTFVRLYFSEKPEPSLSSIAVVDLAGASQNDGRPELVPDDALSLRMRIRPLPTGVYVVNWRIVSAVDGHATAGAYAFGVRMTPTVGLVRSASSTASRSEVIARALLIGGIVLLLGASAMGIARLDGARSLALAPGGWIIATLGLVILAVAQRSNASASMAALLKTPVGRALILRATALGVAAFAIAAARWGPHRFRRPAFIVVALATLAAVAVHVANGHSAAGGRWSPVATVAVQWLHFSAVGVWVGGLVVLLLRVGRATPADTGGAVRHFSNAAAMGLVVVAGTGLLLTAGVLTSWSKSWIELTSTDYGKTVLVKIALLVAIAACGAFNRWRGVPALLTNPRLLRRAGRLELGFMSAAVIAASILGGLPPPAGGAPPGLNVSGTDFGTTVKVRLTTPSDQPGPNRFVVEAVDYDTNAPVRANRVTLRFTPLDDPGVAPTSLPLASGADNTYVGSGANIAFDGRWLVTTLIERASDSVEVPLEIETRTGRQLISIERDPGRFPEYTVEMGRTGRLRLSPQPERPGPSRIVVTFFDVIGDIRPLDSIVVTVAHGRESARQRPVERRDEGRSVADVQLASGENRIGVVARAPDGTRLRTVVTLNVPNR